MESTMKPIKKKGKRRWVNEETFFKYTNSVPQNCLPLKELTKEWKNICWLLSELTLSTKTLQTMNQMLQILDSPKIFEMCTNCHLFRLPLK